MRSTQASQAPSSAQDAIKYLDHDEVTRLLAAVRKLGGKRDIAVWTVAYWRGLRVSEVGRLRYEDWRQGPERLYVRRLKGSISAEYKVSPAEAKVLRAWVLMRGNRPGPLFPATGWKPLSRQHLHNLMLRYSEAAGLPKDKSHFHVLRHSIAVELVDSGVDLLHIKDWLGHRSVQSTMVYAALRNPTRDKVAEQVYKGGKQSQKSNGE